MRALVMILAHNEENSIGDVIAEVRSGVQADVLVVDDGSDDNTREKALEAGARCVSLAFNAGIGVAEQTGFQVADNEGYDLVVRMDGDGQHDPAGVPLFIASLNEGRADLVIGSRYLYGRGGEGLNIRVIGNRFLSWLVSQLTDYCITDATCGFRGYARPAIEAFADDYPDDFPEVEALMMCHHRGFRVEEISIDSLRRQSGESVINAGVAVYYMCKVTLAVAISGLRKRRQAG